MRISVVVATYNGIKYLREQLDSILVNLSDEDEVVVSDDGSTDGTWKLIQEYMTMDARIRLVAGPGQGVKQNFAYGISQAQGDYIFLSDQDDIWLPDKVRRVMAVFEMQQAGLVVHDAVVMNGDCSEVLMESFGAYRGQGAGVISNLIKNKYIGCCMAFKRELVPYILPIPNDIQMHDQWIGMWNDRKFHNTVFTSDKLLYYRRHDDNVSDFGRHGVIQMIQLRLLFLKRFLIKNG